MELKILSQTKNPLMQRQEIEFEAVTEKNTPSRTEIKNKIVALLNSSQDNTIIKKIKNKFGSKNCTGTAFVYESKEKLKKNHRFFLLKREKMATEQEIKKREEKKTKAKQPKK